MFDELLQHLDGRPKAMLSHDMMMLHGYNPRNLDEVEWLRDSIEARGYVVVGSKRSGSVGAVLLLERRIYELADAPCKVVWPQKELICVNTPSAPCPP